MAVTTLISDSPAESVKQDVRSLSTCSASTVSTLQTLLRTTQKANPDGSGDKSSIDAKVRAAGTRRKPSTSARSRTSSRTVAIHLQIATEDASPLSTQQRLVLATEIFNIASKTLSDAAQKQSNSKAPLSQTSPNQVLSPKKPTSSKNPASNAQGTENHVYMVAECARLALSTLRTLKGNNTQQNGDTYPELQLEQGVCVLVGRMLVLGLSDLAYKELRALKKRIQSHLDRQLSVQNAKSKRAAPQPVREDNPAKESIADLLTFSHLEYAKPILGLIVSFQANVMRLLLTERRPSLFQKLTSNLSMSEPASPANVIQTATELGALSKEKAALQLVSLSNNILSLVSTQYKSANAESANSRSQSKPFTILSLQLLSLEIRTVSWRISGHKVEPKKELLDPMSRFLEACAHSGTVIDKVDFKMVYDCFNRLRKFPALDGEAMPWRLLSTVGGLAHDSGYLEEALSLYNEAVSLLPALSDDQPLTLGTLRCRLASIRLKKLKSIHPDIPQNIAKSLVDASEGLKSFNKGSNHDLEELLVESARLKKQAMNILGDVYSSDLPSSSMIVELGDSIVGYLHAFIRFLKRYIGRFSVQGTEGKNGDENALQSLSKSRKVILSALDSVVAVGKASVMNQTPAWDCVSPIFTDCRRVVNMMPSRQGDSDEFGDLRTSLMKISNIFWSKYLKEKESAKSCTEILPLLEQSTVFLQGCSVDDRKTGFAALKCERLAHLYLDCHSRSRAVEALRQSIREYIECGVVSDLVTSLNGASPHRACYDVSSPAFILNRVFTTYLKIQTKRQEENALYDDESLSIQERTVVKEWQVGILMDTHGHETETDFFRTMIQDALSSLFVIYVAETFPLQRLRLIGHVIWLVLERPAFLSEEFVRPLAEEGKKLLSVTETDCLDDQLLHFATHIRNYVRLALLFYDGNIDLNNFREIMESWNAVFEKNRSWTSLQQNIDDPDRWLAHMRFASDYMEARGWWKLQLSTLQTTGHILEHQKAGNDTEAIINLSKCAQVYMRLGDCRSASAALDQAVLSIDNPGVSSSAVVFLALVRAEFFLEIGDLQHAEQMLVVAREKYSSVPRMQEEDKNFLLRMTVDAAVLFSRLYYSQGHLRNALYFAKMSTKLSSKLWAKLERSSERSSQRNKGPVDTPTEQSVIELEPDKPTASDSDPHSTSNPPTISAGATFWPYIHSHHQALMNLGRLSGHNGLFQDAIYYGEQALKVSEALDAPVRIIACKNQLGRDWLRGGRVSDAKRFLTAAVESCKDMDNSLETIACKIGLASMYMARRNHSEVLRLLCDAENSMAGLINLSTQMVPSSSTDLELEEGMAKLSIQTSSTSKAKRPVSKRPTRKANGAVSSSSLPNESTVAQITAIESQAINQLRADILRQQATALSMKQNFEEAFRLLNQAGQLQASTISRVLLQITETEYTLADALRSVASHAVYCVLSESTLSIPSIEVLPDRENGPSPVQKPTRAKRTAMKRAKAPKKEEAPEKGTKEPAIGELLAKTKLSIENTIKNATSFGSTTESHRGSHLAGSVSMLLHATTPGAIEQASLAPAIVNELGRNTAFERERLAIDLDKQLTDFSGSLTWPSLPEHAECINNSDTQSSENFTQILPSNWNVISISLDSNASEFVISKMRRDTAPFLLRLPLKRGGDQEEADEEDFSFISGKDEMKQIIQLANTSAHDARSRTDRKARKDWWAVRESLDQRLKALLENIENIWLGGFRSIFSAFPLVEGSFSQFSASFENILDKHLPSRRKSGGENKRIRLHPDVLELFVGLRNLDELEDPENPITDLLYFVVDILQFQGERNAYDEIDFDAMVIDTLAVLKRYHEAVEVKSQTTAPQHTVLILDKALHLFPWESLPCFEGLPVSRMPSLNCLRDRILQLGIGSEEQNRRALMVDRNDGSFILNPGGDLRATQSNFETDLNNMIGWSAIVDRSPSEEEFKTALDSKSLFLYFGHGSGAQYIRGRTIKRLERCAVTFLMGCSSGCLTEVGEFEPYGTPMNYMHAGSPALVATLWDVTDKDIDRFAQSTFDKWGLVKEKKETETPAVAPKGRGRKGTSKKRDGSTTRDQGAETHPSSSLAEAVAASRDICRLKYLNGAAPVIYGLPMMLGP